MSKVTQGQGRILGHPNVQCMYKKLQEQVWTTGDICHIHVSFHSALADGAIVFFFDIGRGTIDLLVRWSRR